MRVGFRGRGICASIAAISAKIGQFRKITHGRTEYHLRPWLAILGFDSTKRYFGPSDDWWTDAEKKGISTDDIKEAAADLARLLAKGAPFVVRHGLVLRQLSKSHCQGDLVLCQRNEVMRFYWPQCLSQSLGLMQPNTPAIWATEPSGWPDLTMLEDGEALVRRGWLSERALLHVAQPCVPLLDATKEKDILVAVLGWSQRYRHRPSLPV